MNTTISHLKDPDMQAAPLALTRAANKARRLAEQTGTPCVVRKSPVPSGEAGEGLDAAQTSDTSSPNGST